MRYHHYYLWYRWCHVITIFRKCTGGYKLHKSQEKLPNIHGRHQTVCHKWEIIGKLNTGSKDIQWKYRGGIWHRKICHGNNEKWKQQMTEGIELPNQEKKNTRRNENRQILENIESGYN